MASKQIKKAAHWSREKWFIGLLVPAYVALFVQALSMDVLYPAQQSQPVMQSSTSAPALLLPTMVPSAQEQSPTALPQTARKKLDINTADAWMLTAIPGIGEALAERIITFRDARKGLMFLEELRMVSGVGEKLYQTLKAYVEVPPVP